MILKTGPTRGGPGHRMAARRWPPAPAHGRPVRGHGPHPTPIDQQIR